MRKAYFKDWYGKDCKSVEELISYFNQIIEDNVDKLKANEIFKLKPKALIAPHAGWIYSGFSANFAYKIAQNSNPKRVVVIGPSHKFPFDSSSVTLEEEYETPCGNLQIDTEFAKDIMINFNIQNLEYVHQEHSTEVQMPFIKHCINKPIVEIIYSNENPLKIKDIINFAIDKESLVVISTDLSHYYDLKTANRLDSFCLTAIEEISLEYLKGCEACGKIGLEGIILSAKEKNLTSFIVDYRTSADVNQDTNQVVGYTSAIFI